MENRDLMRQLIENFGEESQKNTISESCFNLIVAIKELEKMNRKENHLNYSIAYNNVCERIADMKISLQKAEFLFNTDTINQHYKYKVDDLIKAVSI